MKNMIFVFVIAIFAQISCLSQDNTTNNITKNQTNMTFKIEIINYYFGRVHHKTTVTQDSIICEQFVAVSVHKHNITKRALENNEKINLEEFLSNFPLTDFQENYYNKGVKDGTVIDFIIEINNEKKKIFIGNYYIKELGSLVAEIVKLIPEDYINYTKYSVRTEISIK